MTEKEELNMSGKPDFIGHSDCSICTMTNHCAWVYIITNHYNTTLYVGITTSLSLRIFEHRTKHYPGSFTARYNIYKLVYYEGFELITDAIAREKFIKKKTRKWKDELINGMNPCWSELDANV